MLFNSLAFVFLVAITAVIYYVPLFRKLQVHILIIASLVFYAWHNPMLLILLLSSAAINCITSYLVVYGSKTNRKLIATIGVISNLLILSFFKYSGLIASTWLSPSSLGDLLVSIPLPIGISFFTFQGISLLVDVFKENHFRNNEIIPKSLLTHAKNTLFFISFFPQLVAGPIVKAHDFLPQIKIKTPQDVNWNAVFKNVVLGYFLKMVIADNLKDYTFWIAFPYFETRDSITLLTMLFGYSCQIFADFAGYSLIAIGIAGLYGYDLRDNFNFPYISSSFSEFWKRWHISLSSFLMEYLYIPLGGNRRGKRRTYINLMITMFLGGLWHGAAWSYAVWGIFHGMLLAVERFINHQFNLSPSSNMLVVSLKRVFVFCLITLAWLLFKLPEFDHVILYVAAIFRNTSSTFDVAFCTHILIYSIPIFLYHGLYLLRDTTVGQQILRFNYVIYAVMLFLIATNSGLPGEFIYFQF